MVGSGVVVLASALVLVWAATPVDVVPPGRLRPAAAPMVAPAAGRAQASAPSPFDAALRGLAVTAAERADVQTLYGPDGVTPVWMAGGALSADARAVVALLQSSARHGLNPADYLLGPLAAAVLSVPADAEGQAAFDAALSLGALRYQRHLHLGRVDPRAVGLRLDTWREPHAFAALLRAALASHRAAADIEALAPPFALYAHLIDALARYRALAATAEPVVPPFVRSVHPGEPYAGARALGLHLAARGDLAAADVPIDGTVRYEGALVEGVHRFQARHGLTADGVLGARTVAAARVPAAARVQQIAIALERLRWLPDLGERRLVVVNIPMFQLWAWDTLAGAPPPAFSSRVIVGNAARRTETPVFVESMDRVIFRPYWNVPMSILRNEVLPAMRRDPGYLAKQQMEVVSGPGDDARVVGVGAGTLDALAAGTLRVRQRPGPHNALGLVKFVFPNQESVYLHGTPTPSLFARDRRDFSHGCIRVADPAGLARWVLGDVGGWDDAAIDAAMHAETSSQVTLTAPIDVVLFYLTAVVMPDDGTVHFADDIYGHDAALERALARATAAR